MRGERQAKENLPTIPKSGAESLVDTMSWLSNGWNKMVGDPTKDEMRGAGVERDHQVEQTQRDEVSEL